MSDIAELRRMCQRDEEYVPPIRRVELVALLDRVEAAEKVAAKMEADARERWDPMSEPEDGMYSTQTVLRMAAQLRGKEDR